jgi:hypothetical protein
MVVSEHHGGCHCGNLRLSLRLSAPPAEVRLRGCGCSFCRAHATRTVSDPHGSVRIDALNWALVEPYRFGTGTADFLVCRRCGVYVGAVCDTDGGTRAVINTNCLDSSAEFVGIPAPTVHDGETTSARVARRTANWTPAVVVRVGQA